MSDYDDFDAGEDEPDAQHLMQQWRAPSEDPVRIWLEGALELSANAPVLSRRDPRYKLSQLALLNTDEKLHEWRKKYVGEWGRGKALFEQMLMWGVTWREHPRAGTLVTPSELQGGMYSKRAGKPAELLTWVTGCNEASRNQGRHSAYNTLVEVSYRPKDLCMRWESGSYNYDYSTQVISLKPLTLGPRFYQVGQ